MCQEQVLYGATTWRTGGVAKCTGNAGQTAGAACWVARCIAVGCMATGRTTAGRIVWRLRWVPDGRDACVSVAWCVLVCRVLGCRVLGCRRWWSVRARRIRLARRSWCWRCRRWSRGRCQQVRRRRRRRRFCGTVRCWSVWRRAPLGPWWACRCCIGWRRVTCRTGRGLMRRACHLRVYARWGLCWWLRLFGAPVWVVR